MDTVDLLKQFGNGGLGLASLYVVYLVIRLCLDYSGTRQKAADDLALKTIDVVSRSSEAMSQVAKALDVTATANTKLAEAMSSLAAAIRANTDKVK